MKKFAEQCTQNLETWDTRSKELRATTSAPPETPQPETICPSSLPKVFLSAFPLALPVHCVGTPTEDTRTTLSDSESTPTPPHTTPPSISAFSSSTLTSPTESVGSYVFSPRSDTPSTPSTHPYQLSSASSATSSSDATNAMRAAYHASVRKKRSIQNRNSWNASPIAFYSPPPPLAPRPVHPTVVLNDSPFVKESLVPPDSFLKPDDSITSDTILSPPTQMDSDP